MKTSYTYILQREVESYPNDGGVPISISLTVQRPDTTIHLSCSVCPEKDKRIDELEDILMFANMTIDTLVTYTDIKQVSYQMYVELLNTYKEKYGNK